jgi:hypothetical protein
LTESAAKLAAGDIIDTEAQMAIVSILAAPELQEFLMPGASNQLWRLTAKWIPSCSTMFAGYFRPKCRKWRHFRNSYAISQLAQSKARR